MTRLRATFFWLHLAAGATAGVVILIMSATGAVLALKPQILAFIDRDVRTVASDGRAPLPVSQVLAAAGAAMPDATITSIAVERDPAKTIAIAAGGRTVYADPYTGAILGEASRRPVAFFRSVENWHRWLALSNDNRAAGRAVTGASNLVFLGLALSGLYLWWPRSWTPQHTRAILAFRRTATGRARDFNWHNVIGFWCLVPIVLMTTSGVVMSYPWANTLLYRVTGSEPPAGGRGGGARVPAGDVRHASPLDQARLAVIDAAWQRAAAAVPEWKTITLRVPPGEDAPLAFSLTDGASWNPFARSQLTLDAATLEPRQWQPYAAQSLGQRARGWVRFGHTGELGGLPGQIVAGLGCVGGVVLVYTGLALAIRRLAAWRTRGRRAVARDRSLSTPSTESSL